MRTLRDRSKRAVRRAGVTLLMLALAASLASCGLIGGDASSQRAPNDQVALTPTLGANAPAEGNWRPAEILRPAPSPTPATAEPPSLPRPVEMGPLAASGDLLALAKRFDEEQALEYVQSLTEPRFDGRHGGSAGGALAAGWLAEQFAALGLQPAGTDGYMQPFLLPYAELTSTPTLEITLDGHPVGQPLLFRTDFGQYWGGYSGGGEAEGQVYWVGGGQPEDYLGLDVAGGVVLADARPSDEVIRLALEHGAEGLLLLAQNDHQVPQKRTYRAAPYVPTTLPVLIVSDAAAAALLAGSPYALSDLSILYQSLPLATRASLTLQMDEPGDVWGRNVLGALVGADPQARGRVLVLGAHYDHVGSDPHGDLYPGANDDASGVAVLLEIARLWQAEGFAPQHTILLAAWDGEEQGLLGAAHYVQNPVYPLADTLGMIQLDMVGLASEGVMTVDGLPSGIRERSRPAANLAGVHPVARQLAYSAELLGIPTRGTAFRGMSDHAPFMQAGLPASLLIWDDGEVPYYHTPQDTWQTLQPERLWQVGALTAHAAMALASEAPRLDAALERQTQAIRAGDLDAYMDSLALDPETRLADYARVWFDHLTPEARQRYTATLQSTVVGDRQARADLLASGVDAQGFQAEARYPITLAHRDDGWRLGWPVGEPITGTHLTASSLVDDERTTNWARALDQSYGRVAEALAIADPPQARLMIYAGQRDRAWLAPDAIARQHQAALGASLVAGDHITRTAVTLMLESWGLAPGEGFWLRSGLALWVAAALAEGEPRAIGPAEPSDDASIGALLDAEGEPIGAQARLAHSLTGYLLETYGAEGLAALCAAWGEGGLNVGLATIGLTRQELAAAWRRERLEPLLAASQQLDDWAAAHAAALLAHDKAAYLDGISPLDSLYTLEMSRRFDALTRAALHSFQVEIAELAWDADELTARVEIAWSQSAAETAKTSAHTWRFQQVHGRWRLAGPLWTEYLGRHVLLQTPHQREENARNLAIADRAYERVCGALNCPAAGPVSVQMYDSRSALEATLPSASLTEGGAWIVPEGLIALPSQGEPEALEAELVEALVRMVLAQGAETPAWLTEGIVAHLRSETGANQAALASRLVRAAREAQRFDKLYPWDALPDPSGLTGDERQVALGQALYLTQELARTQGEDALNSLLAALRAGDDWRTAFHSTSGQTWPEAAPRMGSSLATGGLSPSQIELARSYSVDGTLDTIRYLTTPELLGRRAGSPEAHQAAEWLAARLGALGLQPAGETGSYFRRVPVSLSELADTPTLQATGPEGKAASFAFPEDFRDVLSGAAGDGHAIGELVWLPRGFEEGMLLNGRPVAMDARDDPADLADEALAHGASALILVKPYFEAHERQVHGRPPQSASLPTVLLTEEAWRRLLATGGHSLSSVRDGPPALLTGISVTLDVPVHTVINAEALDVVAELPGSDPTALALVMVSHYDSVGAIPHGAIYPGANRGLSGVATLLEVARLWQESGGKPRASLYFVFLGAQEVGGASAQAFAGRPYLARERIGQVIVLGELGEARSYWLTIDGDPEAQALVDQMLLAAELSDRRVSPGRQEGAGILSQLRAEGWPTTLLFWPNPRYTHTPNDTADALDPHKLATAGETLVLTTILWAR